VKQQQAHKTQPATTKQSQHITREVEKIVREEREAMDKMPSYKGLERYKLVEKKGECDIFTRLIRGGRLTDLLCSGAFSNVYKALDLTSGMHVAGTPFPPQLATFLSPDQLLLVKAVRKFELTPSQVSIVFFLTFQIPSIPPADPDLTRGSFTTCLSDGGEPFERPF
jgi:hypothetical protein